MELGNKFSEILGNIKAIKWIAGALVVPVYLVLIVEFVKNFLGGR